MTITKKGELIGRVPLDDIGVLLCNARGLTYANGLMVELARRGAAMVICDNNYLPVAWLWPLDGHHVQAMRIRHQLGASKPLCKRLWQSVIRAKITGQAETLQLLGRPSESVAALARRVRSGDPANVEAQAARRYWPLVFGPAFRRDRFGDWPNPMLNYGYTVLRAAVARAVVSAGLHPSVGIHHSNRGNPMCLVDDLMEPFRPVVDFRVARLNAEGHREMTPQVKEALGGVLMQDMATIPGTSPLETCLERCALSLANSYESGTPSLEYPSRPVMELAPETAT